ncbi:MAG: ATP-dependent helicase [Candidatus Nanopelagicales bacterium]
MSDSLLLDLDEAQLAAVTTTSGAVAIYAGAGSGKTRVLTRRIAYAVSKQVVNPKNVLALTFTTRAADEMALRLAQLGIRDLAVRTFHSAALRQLKFFWPDVIGGPLPKITTDKFNIVKAILKQIGAGQDVQTIRDVISEIEKAKVNRLEPESLPVEKVREAYRLYLEKNDELNQIDFEDALLLLVAILEEHPNIARRVQNTFSWFSVDEYQDVNPLQQNLLDLWLGNSQEICVVGDTAQTIYTFAGANPENLLNFTERFPRASVFKLNRNYRSADNIVQTANKVLSAMGRTHAAVGGLVATRELPGEVKLERFNSDWKEAQAVSKKIKEMINSGTNPAEIAILYRINWQAEILKTALTSDGINFWLQSEDRYEFKQRVEPRISLATMHATKGLEWANVFLIGLSEGIMPISQAVSEEEILEEQRLFYVAVTRARDFLHLSWAKAKDEASPLRTKSQFLKLLNLEAAAVSDQTDFSINKPQYLAPVKKAAAKCKKCRSGLMTGAEITVGRCNRCASDTPPELYKTAFKTRNEIAAKENIPEFLVLTDSMLIALVDAWFEKTDPSLISSEKWDLYRADLEKALSQI